MGNYPNQKTITLEGVDRILHTKDNGNTFIWSIDFKYEAVAMRRLNGNAYKLWRYLLRWYGDGRVDFSPAALKKELGFGKNAPGEAVAELLRWGYLRQDPLSESKYIFNPVLTSDYEELKDIKN